MTPWRQIIGKYRTFQILLDWTFFFPLTVSIYILNQKGPLSIFPPLSILFGMKTANESALWTRFWFSVGSWHRPLLSLWTDFPPARPCAATLMSLDLGKKGDKIKTPEQRFMDRIENKVEIKNVINGSLWAEFVIEYLDLSNNFIARQIKGRNLIENVSKTCTNWHSLQETDIQPIFAYFYGWGRLKQTRTGSYFIMINSSVLAKGSPVFSQELGCFTGCVSTFMVTCGPWVTFPSHMTQPWTLSMCSCVNIDCALV